MENIKIKDILGKYNLSESDIRIVFDKILEKAKMLNIEVVMTDLSHVKEVEVFRESLAVEAKDEHHETCVTDGKTVYMHNRDDKNGGIAGQLYDLLHVAMGHLWQWGSDQKGGLKFFGDFSFELGTVFFLGANDEQLSLVREYEKEGSMIALQNLREVLKEIEFPVEKKDQIVKFCNDYMNTDLWYIIDYYKNGIEKPFYDYWMFDAPMLSPIQLPASVNPKKRNAPAIPLISKR